jgi:hypothetical protein
MARDLSGVYFLGAIPVRVQAEQGKERFKQMKPLLDAYAAQLIRTVDADRSSRCDCARHLAWLDNF